MNVKLLFILTERPPDFFFSQELPPSFIGLKMSTKQIILWMKQILIIVIQYEL